MAAGSLRRSGFRFLLLYEPDTSNVCVSNLERTCVQVLVNDNFRYGYNAATGKYEDLMAAGIIDPTKVRANCVDIFLSFLRTSFLKLNISL